ncbi:uncharacterized protein LOC131665484 [Phymastichus coffea]|uniref:uncharacterized protein LOC131665484 n=1 Tax=Phymastichus coffea TaxID=108790 RepID=UPI00273C4A35|nr:uncharacterized protein LOC131665484 [Phymastichus coffea]
MYAAINTRNYGTINMLQGTDFNVNAEDDQQRTAIWYAVHCMNPPAVLFLLEHGAKPNDGLDALCGSTYEFSDNRLQIRCLELLLRYGLSLSAVDTKQRTIFEIATEDHNVKLLNTVLEHVAMSIALDQHVEKAALAKIRSHRETKEYFDGCQKIIKDMKDTAVYETATLFDVLTKSKEQVLKYVQNAETVEILNCIMYEMGNSKFGIIKFLRNRIETVIEIAKLRKQATLSIQKIIELKYYPHVMNMIINFLDKQSLENLCQI